jgi:spore photoproduct lyase
MHFDPRRICLAKGCLTTPERRQFVQRICDPYPDAKLVDRQDVPHNRIDRVATLAGRPVPFYLGKLQDGLALDPLTDYSTALVPFFARHPYARQVIFTKSTNVERLFEVEHAGHAILTWSLNPPEVVRDFENNVPPVEERLAAMRRCAAHGYPLRAVLMPIIPVEDRESVYEGFLRRLLAEVPL